jgi:hypothetical protein
MTDHFATARNVTPLRQRMIEDMVNCRDILARKKKIYAVSLNVDRSINRAMVAGCAISATRNYLKLHMPKTLNPLLSNLHAKTQKLWKHSAVRVAAFRPHAVSANCPLMHSAFPPRCPPHSTSPRAAAIPSIEGDANTRSS